MLTAAVFLVNDAGSAIKKEQPKELTTIVPSALQNLPFVLWRALPNFTHNKKDNDREEVG